MDFNQFIISVESILGKPIEQLLRFQNKDNNRSIIPIWIIGSPRSGTTLMYQLTCSYLMGYYLTNRVANRYRISLITRAIERRLYAKSPIPTSFRSKFGNTKNENDPHEGGQFFYQFFPKEQPYSTSKDLTNKQKEDIQTLIRAITTPFDLFISKNTFHSLRIKALSDLFPKSIFIWVRRETAATVYSILKARNKLQVSDKEWWGITPPGWETAQTQSVIDQTIWQVKETERIIERDLRNVHAQCAEVNYKQICEAPHSVLKSISDTYGLQKFVRANEDIIPNSFSYSDMPENSLSERIRQALL